MAGDSMMRWRDENLRVDVHVQRLGSDACIMIFGGDAPHIGCAVMAEPRESLRGNGEWSATASVLNATGHKDDEVALPVARSVAARLKCRTVVVCGIHYETFDGDLAAYVEGLAKRIADAILAAFESSSV